MEEIIRVGLKGLVVHFFITHSLLLILHAVLHKYIHKTLGQAAPSHQFNLVWCLPADIIFTFTAVGACLQLPEKTIFFYWTLVSCVSALLNLLAELRVLVYFGQFPKKISTLMFTIRTLSHATGNIAMVVAIYPDLRK